jgi:hypothetical protein
MEIRRLQVTTIAGLDFPHATQALRITRRVRSLHGRRWRTVVVYAITSLTAAQASPACLADWIRGVAPISRRVGYLAPAGEAWMLDACLR